MLLKSTFVISILFVYLISLTEFNQLAKLPVLAEHFIEHKQKNRELSFWEFLNMHYANQNEGTDDRDSQLPFKSHDNCTASFSLAFVNESHVELPIKQILPCISEFRKDSDQFISASYLSAIWQPPKSC